MDGQYESLKNKLKKLLALAERGVQGEVENARKLLEKLCKEHGVSITARKKPCKNYEIKY